MNDHSDPPASGEEDDPVLVAAGARLRDRSNAISPSTVEAAVLRRRTRRLRVFAGVSMALVALLGGLLLVQRGSKPDRGQDEAGSSSGRVERLIASLGPQPVNPTRVKLVSTVSTFSSCDALIGDLRRVGAEHVGSQGFGAYSGGFQPVGGH